MDENKIKDDNTNNCIKCSWEDFPSKIAEIKNKYDLRYEKIKPTLYRGHSSSKWHLDTTLERFDVNREWSISGYVHSSNGCMPAISSFTGSEWDYSKPYYETIEEIEKEMSHNAGYFHLPTPCYIFWIYLRHHGFPSPLLDWTESPYVAAFFAFEKKLTKEEEENDPNVAVCVYIENHGPLRAYERGPMITAHGPYVIAHKRHFIQQAQYTTCTSSDIPLKFINHQLVIDQNDPGRNLLIKITIPRSERLKALRDLDAMNINHYSLFQSEEALIKTMAFREIELKESKKNP